jgi:hypothetical protein
MIIVPLQMVAGAILAVAIYFGSASLFYFVTNLFRPIFQYGFSDSLFLAIVLYVPILSVISACIFIFRKKMYWLFSGFIVGILAALIIMLQGLAGL